MSSFGSLLSIARNAITAHQVAIQTVSHNIANVETQGYSRQRAELVTATPQVFPFGSIGNGVGVDQIVRMRDQLLDASYRSGSGNREAYATRRDLLGEVEGVMGEPSATGLANTLDQFWNAWSDLSNNPGNAAAQGIVRQRGAQVAYTLNTYASRMDDVANRTRSQLSSSVDEVNLLTRQFASLNGQITSAEVSGQQAPDLRDTRDQIADRLSKIAGVRVEQQANGSVGVYLGGVMLVDANNARTLEVRAGTTLSVGLKGDPDPLMGVSGTLGAMIDVVNVDIPAVRQRLDDFARGLVNGTNEYHASGWTAAGDALGNSNWVPANGPTGSRVNFFDAGFTSAGTMRLSAEVLADASVIASSDAQNAPGNNTIALALAGLRDDSGMAALQTRMGANFATQIGFATGVSFGDHYATTVTNVGVEIASADGQFTVFDVLTQQADNRRSSVNGVSLDEELTLLMRHQQAYVAATRLVTVADEMAQAVLGMV